jgi:pimeloyl-ACP methyl ester carboxylesterase
VRRQFRRPKTGRVALILTAIVLLLLWPSAREHVRAMSLLARMSQQQNFLVRLGKESFNVRSLSFAGANGPIQAKLYVPASTQHPPAMVVVHGLHQLGMEEPRLVNFAKSLAETGVEVLTPQVDALTDYRVVPESIDVIGSSAQQLSHLVGGQQVGVLGLSFAGGLSLMAAAEPQYAEAIGFVAAVGAQDDVQRVEHYLLEGQTKWPDGRPLTTPPHEYGWLILIYSHPEDFFAPLDVETARNSIRLLLHEEIKGSEALAQKLSPDGQKLMTAIFQHQRDGFRATLEADLDSHSAEALAVSPHGRLQGLKAKVLLVHGEGDDVIPPSETKWLAKDIPAQDLQAALISRSISHVSLERQPGWRDQLAVVHWIALMLADADREKVVSSQ